MYNRLRNEAVDNERKTQREAFELLAKHIELMNQKDDRKPKRALKTMTDAQESRIKALVSEMGITINTIFQNFGKATFGGIGGLQTRYENLATAMREILQGPYDTEDKEAALKLTTSLVPKLTKLQSLLRNASTQDSFTLSEKRIVEIIKNNIEQIPGKQGEPIMDYSNPERPRVAYQQGATNYQNLFQPIGQFTEVLVADPEMMKRAQAKATAKSLRTIEDTDDDYVQLVNTIAYLIEQGQGDIITKAKTEQRKLKKDTKDGLISATIFKNISDKVDVLENRLEALQVAEEVAPPPEFRGRPGPTTRQSQMRVGDEGAA